VPSLVEQSAARSRSSLGCLLEIAAVVALSLGVIAQFVQWTDPTFPLAYFTIDSAILFVLVSLGQRLVPEWRTGRAIRDSLTPAVVLSGVIYAAVIAPAVNGGAWYAPGDDWVCRSAQVLVHGVGPVLALASLWTRGVPGQPNRPRSWWLAWPLGYLAVIMVLDVSPYAFLAPGIPAWQLSGTVLVLACAYLAMSWLCVLVARGGRHLRTRIPTE
jgi:hypothetical protein